MFGSEGRDGESDGGDDILFAKFNDLDDDPDDDSTAMLNEDNRSFQIAESVVEEAEGRCREAERRLGEAVEEYNRRVRAAERRADIAERRAREAERRLVEAMEESGRRVQVAEGIAWKADREKGVAEAEQQAMQAEKRLRKFMEESDRRIRAAEHRANTAESKATEAERRLAVSEGSLRECKEKLQRLETEWVVERREIQLTGSERTGDDAEGIEVTPPPPHTHLIVD